MQLELTEREHFDLQNLITRAREENEKEIAVANETKWKGRAEAEQKSLDSIYLKIS